MMQVFDSSFATLTELRRYYRLTVEYIDFELGSFDNFRYDVK